MTSLLRLKLPLSTNFGNAKHSTWASDAPRLGTAARQSAGNADFAVAQTQLFPALLGQRRNQLSLGENQAPRTKISAMIQNGFMAFLVHKSGAKDSRFGPCFLV